MALVLPFSLFNAGSLTRIFLNASVKRVVLDSSNNAYIAGSFTTLNGMSRKYVAKILATNDSVDGIFTYSSLANIPEDAALDASGNLLVTAGNTLLELRNITGNPTAVSYALANGPILSIFNDSSDNIFISGFFTTVSSVLRTGFAKLTSSGTFDAAFTSNLSGGTYVLDMDAVPATTNLFVGGTFTTIGGSSRVGFAKVNINTGATIADLDCNLNNSVFSVHMCSDGNVFIGGSFTNIKTTSTIKGFGKVNTLGTLVGGFTQSAITWNYVTKIVEYKSGVHAGKILVAGFEGTTPKIYRLSSTGTIDTSFGTSGSISATAVTGTINDIAIRSDSSAVVVGDFTTIGSKERSYYAKISASGEVL